MTWRMQIADFSYNTRLFVISFAQSFFLGCYFDTVKLKECKPANDMAAFAAANSANTATWVKNFSGEDEPTFSTE